MGKLYIEIAGISCEIKSRNNQFIDELKEQYKGFISRTLPENKISLSEKKSISFRRRLKIAEIREKNQRVFDIIFRDIRAILNLKKKEVKVDLQYNLNSFNSLLRILYTLFLLEEEGFLLHAAGVKKRDKAYIFYGRSSAGKTTIARLSEDYDLLSDEIVAIKKEGDNFYAYGTPFWGEMIGKNNNKKAEIKSFFKLKKGEMTKIEEMELSRAIKTFIPCVVFFFKSEDYTWKLFDICVDTLGKNLVYQLTFKPDESLWKGIEEFEGFALPPK